MISLTFLHQFKAYNKKFISFTSHKIRDQPFKKYYPSEHVYQYKIINISHIEK